MISVEENFKQIRQFIIEDNVEKALDLLSNSTNKEETKSEILLVKNNYTRLNKRIRNNLIDNNQSDVRMNKIIENIISLTNEIEKENYFNSNINEKILDRDKIIEIIIDGEINDFNKTRKENLVSTVAAILKIDKNLIEIKRVFKGSLKIHLKLPEKDAIKLLELLNDIESIEGFIDKFKIIDIGTPQQVDRSPLGFEEINSIFLANKREFKDSYFKEEIPVIISDFSRDWGARKKWNFEFLSANYGDITVPLYDLQNISAGQFLESHKTLKLKEYIEVLKKGPTSLTPFLFNLFKFAPELKNDFNYPDIIKGYFKELNFLSFGSIYSKANLHYEIDLSSIFITQFEGRKRVILIPPSEKEKIIKLDYPITTNIDLDFPDFSKHPGLKDISGFECIIYPGETLFIPGGYWYYTENLDNSISLTLRANPYLLSRAKGAFNIAKYFVVDRSMNYIIGNKWSKMKEELAKKRFLESISQEKNTAANNG